jgi:hypothetical protein
LMSRKGKGERASIHSHWHSAFVAPQCCVHFPCAALFLVSFFCGTHPSIWVSPSQHHSHSPQHDEGMPSNFNQGQFPIHSASSSSALPL